MKYQSGVPLPFALRSSSEWHACECILAIQLVRCRGRAGKDALVRVVVKLSAQNTRDQKIPRHVRNLLGEA